MLHAREPVFIGYYHFYFEDIISIEIYTHHYTGAVPVIFFDKYMPFQQVCFF